MDELELRQAAENIAQGLDSGFWAWMQEQMAAELRDLVGLLSLPEGMRPRVPGREPEPDDFVRGKIRAINWLLGLPNGFMAQYAVDQAVDQAANLPLDPPGTPRRASPTPREEQDGTGPGGTDQL